MKPGRLGQPADAEVPQVEPGAAGTPGIVADAGRPTRGSPVTWEVVATTKDIGGATGRGHKYPSDGDVPLMGGGRRVGMSLPTRTSGRTSPLDRPGLDVP